MYYRPNNLYTLDHLLSMAEKGGYAIGAFSPRWTPVIKTIFQTAQELSSPVIIQIAQVELSWFETTLANFAHDFWELVEKEPPAVPFGLHLDHTQDFELIKEAIALGFTSVMIDASAMSFEENIHITRRVVDYAHARGVSVEAELGKIGSADQLESESLSDEELFTDPQEAEAFVEETGVDALAVSVGTAHGVYTVRQPRVDVERIKAIRARTPVHLVLHGGSGTPKELIHPAIQLKGGGISKINIATDLELAFLEALGKKDRLVQENVMKVPVNQLAPALKAVSEVVKEKIIHTLESQNHTGDFKL